MYKEQHNNFALVMMDIFLPKMDGLQSIRLIRKFEAENKSKRIPSPLVFSYFFCSLLFLFSSSIPTVFFQILFLFLTNLETLP